MPVVCFRQPFASCSIRSNWLVLIGSDRKTISDFVCIVIAFWDRSPGKLLAGQISMKSELTARHDIALFKEGANALFSGYRKCRGRWEKSQVKRAEGFNLLEIMGVDTKELCHSRLLEWLFGREIDQGTHA